MSNESQITTIDDAPAADKITRAPRKGKSPGDAPLSGNFVMLTIHPTSEDGGNDAVFVGHNGTGYQIPRGKPFRVPREVAEVVENAMVTTFKPGNSGGVVTTTVPRFAHSIQPA